MAKKEQLEKSRAKVQKLMREGHVTEQIQQKEKMTKELVENTDVDLEFELISKPVLSITGRNLVFAKDDILPFWFFFTDLVFQLEKFKIL